MSDLLGPVAASVERAMQFRVARQAVLASNLANADTPGYRRADVHFDSALDSAAVRLASRHPSHRSSSSPHGFRVVTERASDGPDRNGVDPDRESIEVSRNAGDFNRQAEVYARLLMLTRTAIDGGSR
ncbi:MAG: flagellar basal body rod protein FlgB [Myxococcota bacterium]